MEVGIFLLSVWRIISLAADGLFERTWSIGRADIATDFQELPFRRVRVQVKLSFLALALSLHAFILFGLSELTLFSIT